MSLGYLRCSHNARPGKALVGCAQSQAPSDYRWSEGKPYLRCAQVDGLDDHAPEVVERIVPWKVTCLHWRHLVIASEGRTSVGASFARATRGLVRPSLDARRRRLATPVLLRAKHVDVLGPCAQSEMFHHGSRQKAQNAGKCASGFND